MSDDGDIVVMGRGDAIVVSFVVVCSKYQKVHNHLFMLIIWEREVYLAQLLMLVLCLSVWLIRLKATLQSTMAKM